MAEKNTFFSFHQDHSADICHGTLGEYLDYLHIKYRHMPRHIP